MIALGTDKGSVSVWDLKRGALAYSLGEVMTRRTAPHAAASRKPLEQDKWDDNKQHTLSHTHTNARAMHVMGILGDACDGYILSWYEVQETDGQNSHGDSRLKRGLSCLCVSFFFRF